MMDSLFSLEYLGTLLTGIVCVILTAAWYLHQQHLKYDHLPGPPRDSFWSGHLPSIQKVISDGGIFDDYILELTKTYGKILRLCMWHQTFVIVADPELVKEVLVTGNHPKSKTIYANSTHLFGARYLGRGIESETDQKFWIIQRMHLDHWFKPQHLRRFNADINEFADSLVRQMEQCADGKTHVPMEKLFHKVTLHLLSKVAYNFDLGKLDEKSHPFAYYLEFALSAFIKKVLDPFFSLNPLNWRYCLEVRNVVKQLRLHAKDQITERKKAKLRGDHVPYDLLESFLELQEKRPLEITDAILVDNFVTFLIAGEDTTANTLSFMIFLLSQNPECYKKLQEEIDTNVAAVSVITPDEIDDLPYLDMVMKETLRLYPIIKSTYRETGRECNIGGYTLPIGTDIVVSFYATSRSSKTLTDPHLFIPERFDSKAKERVATYVSTPFSAGPHTCIGKKFAQIETKIIMAKIIQTFDFELVPGQAMGTIDKTMLHPAGGATCFLRQRKDT
ncbi:cholesterol 24-hydroxylase-like [Pecten maximus]|uniref:cholesterol 24-hydroxylase-like n=1 Tax=Pecten maximus TaxID=6579 RepID=UPI00145818E5|nr:cholesterol 24-hydroxylase-like [Pecten maximus]